MYIVALWYVAGSEFSRTTCVECVILLLSEFLHLYCKCTYNMYTSVHTCIYIFQGGSLGIDLPPPLENWLASIYMPPPP